MGCGQELMGVALLARGYRRIAAPKGRRAEGGGLNQLSFLGTRTMNTPHGAAQGVSHRVARRMAGLIQALHNMVDRPSNSVGPAIPDDAIEGAPIRLP